MTTLIHSPHPDYSLNTLVAYDFTGDDACTFLQAQLTSDVKALSINEAQYTAYCSPKGRMLGNGYLLRLEESSYRWIMDTSIAERLIKRLSMFVLRSKVKISLASVHIYGHVESIDTSMIPQKRPAENNTEAPTLYTRFHIIQFNDDLGYALQLASDYSTRWLYLYHSPVEINNTDDERHVQAWHYASVLADEVIVTNATHEELIPQMIEWDRLGGVSFKKGCYPGQEIVARSHYLGKMKRRLFALSTKSASPIAIGTAVVVATHPEQSLGMIVATAYHSEQGQCYALAVLSTDLLEATHIETPSHLGCRTEQGIEPLTSIYARFPETINKTAA